MRRLSTVARRSLALAGTVAALLVPAPAAPQGGDCELVSVGGYTLRARFDSVSFVHHATGGIDYRCADGMRLLADSAVVFEANEQVHLFGRVYLVDAETELDADTAQYFGGLRQLNAWSNVTVRDLASGAVISGERLVYDRAGEVRALDRMQVYGGTPHATVYPVARAEAPPEDAAAGDSVPEEGGATAGDSADVEEAAAAGDSVPEADSVPVGDSAEVAEAVAAGDSVPEADSVPVGDSAEVAEAVAAGDSAAIAPALDSAGAEARNAVPDSAGDAAIEPTLDSAEAAEPLPAEVGEEVDSVLGDPPVVDTVALSPYEIDAERFVLEGRRYFRAGGSVMVVRDSLTAFGDSLDYDQEVGSMSIVGGARVEGQDYLLTARTISVTPSTGLREELLARHRAILSGRQVDMNAPAIRMYLDGGLVNRLVAIGTVPALPGEPQPLDTEGLSPGDAARVQALAADPGDTEEAAPTDSLFKPTVAADAFNLSGDSIDVLSPGQVLQLVTAVGSARAEGEEDDTAAVAAAALPDAARRDWMEGDTIYARFASAGDSVGGAVAGDSAGGAGAGDSADSLAAGDSTDDAADSRAAGDSSLGTGGEGSRLETMTAVGGARSLYRLVQADTLGTDSVGADPIGGGADVDSAGTAADPGGAGAGADSADADAGSADMADGPGGPALHWVEGNRIIVYLEGREVVRMDVEGQTVGYHLEPLPPGTEPDSTEVADSTEIADSTVVAPDTTVVAPDTTGVATDTTAPPDAATPPRGSAATRPDTLSTARDATAHRTRALPARRRLR